VAHHLCAPKIFLRSKVRYKIFSRKSEAPQHTSLTLRTTGDFAAVGEIMYFVVYPEWKQILRACW
jgi:hypothetical protein